MFRRQKAYRLKTIWTDDLENGIFAHLQSLDVPWKTDNIYANLDLAYHANHSGDKIVSPVIDRYIDGMDDLALTELQKTTLAALCFNLFENKWNRLYELTKIEYNPISNYDMIEQETTNESGESEEAHTGTDTTTNTGTVQNTESGTRQGTHTGTETTASSDQSQSSGTSSVDSGIAGFNSSDFSDSTNSNGTTSESGSVTHSETRTPNLTDGETTSGTNTRTDNTTEALQHGETVNGTRSNEITRELTRSGNIGVTTSQQMAQSEIELWQWNFFQSVFKDIDTVLTIEVY